MDHKLNDDERAKLAHLADTARTVRAKADRLGEHAKESAVMSVARREGVDLAKLTGELVGDVVRFREKTAAELAAEGVDPKDARKERLSLRTLSAKDRNEAVVARMAKARAKLATKKAARG